MPAQKTQYFCFVEANKLTLMSSVGVSLQLAFPADVVSDLEVISREKCAALLEQFLQSSAIAPGPILLLLAPHMLFEQDLSTTAPGGLDQIAQTFIDSVPFENVLSKRLMVNGKLRLVCVNKEYIDVLQRTFDKKGFTVHGVVPYTCIQVTVPELAVTINPVVIFSKFDSFRVFSLTVPGIIPPTAFEKKTGLRGQRDMLLIGVFGVLLLILFYLLLTTFVFAPSVAKKVKPRIVPVKSKPLIFPTVSATQSGKATESAAPTK